MSQLKYADFQVRFLLEGWLLWQLLSEEWTVEPIHSPHSKVHCTATLPLGSPGSGEFCLSELPSVQEEGTCCYAPPEVLYTPHCKPAFSLRLIQKEVSERKGTGHDPPLRWPVPARS